MQEKRTPDNAVRLPWLTKPQQFTDDCTRCGKCIEACETKIITKSDGGFPSVDFSIDECTFCYQCANACPEPPFLARNRTTLASKSKYQRLLSKTKCRMPKLWGGYVRPDGNSVQIRTGGKVAQPNLDLDECNGCGACVSVCPTSSINVSNTTA
ncbi:LOW QUALITY PROTEIN: ferredoxin-type protein NapF [Vibrio sp. JCM 18904]|nr:LOW QUALITY PROTEIN: ferredoxin-type protein NapF [Vibrio sp. JCM 18904]